MALKTESDRAEQTLELVTQINVALEKLNQLYKEHERKFTLDGHAVGSLGEVVAASLFGLELMSASNTG